MKRPRVYFSALGRHYVRLDLTPDEADELARHMPALDAVRVRSAAAEARREQADLQDHLRRLGERG